MLSLCPPSSSLCSYLRGFFASARLHFVLLFGHYVRPMGYFVDASALRVRARTVRSRLTKC